MKRVVITGAGTVNPLAQDVTGTLAAMSEGRCAIGPIDLADVARLGIRIAAQVRDWIPEAHFGPASLNVMDRFSQFAVVSARQAVAQSGLRLDGELAARSGVVFGSSAGGLVTLDENFRAVYQAGKNRVSPYVVPRLMANAAANHISMAYGLQGPCLTISNACASSSNAIGLAFQMVRAGLAPVMVAGGADAMITFGGMKAWEGLRVMSPDACRPFSKDRTGMVMGEGAAAFVLEDREQAKARGADILAEVAGYAANSDAQDLLQPSAKSVARAIRMALQDARTSAERIGYINAHGTGTRANDMAETAALHDVFGDRIARLPVSSTKAMHGHLMGGTGGVELLACLLALNKGVLAPTIGYQLADPDCALDVVPNEARDTQAKIALSTSLAFGGTNAAIILRKG